MFVNRWLGAVPGSRIGKKTLAGTQEYRGEIVLHSAAVIQNPGSFADTKRHIRTGSSLRFRPAVSDIRDPAATLFVFSLIFSATQPCDIPRQMPTSSKEKRMVFRPFAHFERPQNGFARRR